MAVACAALVQHRDAPFFSLLLLLLFLDIGTGDDTSDPSSSSSIEKKKPRAKQTDAYRRKTPTWPPQQQPSTPRIDVRFHDAVSLSTLPVKEQAKAEEEVKAEEEAMAASEEEEEKAEEEVRMFLSSYPPPFLLFLPPLPLLSATAAASLEHRPTTKQTRCYFLSKKDVVLVLLDLCSRDDVRAVAESPSSQEFSSLSRLLLLLLLLLLPLFLLNRRR